MKLGNREITPEILPKLTYARSVIDESMRLRHPGFGLMRTAQTDDEIDGYRIPKGTNIIIGNYHIFRHPEFWEHPETFDPNHFLPEKVAQRPKFAYFPFGAGPHICIGKNFAQMELTIILASIVQRFQVELVPDQSFEIDPRFTVRPKYGVKVQLQTR